MLMLDNSWKERCKWKNNYRPGSMLTNISKIYEELFYNQLYDYFDDIISPSQCGFLKGYNVRKI